MNCPSLLAGIAGSDANGIFRCEFNNTAQSVEREMRGAIAADRTGHLLDRVSASHSIPVMDRELNRFLERVPRGGCIVDVGGCWGWHWRKLAATRPDVSVVIVDFVCENLLYARDLLGSAINQSVFLVHGDATDLRFPAASFDGYWTVQTLQHIPSFESAVREAHRVLKPGGTFANYSLINQPPVKLLYRIFGKTYVTKRQVSGAFWLERAGRNQKQIVESVFATPVVERHSEILYSPELHFTAPGLQGSFLGRIDVRLSNEIGLFGSVARQRSYHCTRR